MPIPTAPYGFTATTSGTNTIDLFGYAGDDYSSVRLYYSTDGSTYTFFRSIIGVLTTGETFSYADTPIPANQRYYYYATGVQGANESAASDADSAAFWADTVTVTVSASPAMSTAFTDSVSASVGAAATTSSSVGYNDTVTASVGVAATTESSASVRTNYGTYLGDVTGKVHSFSPDLLSFNGAAINSYWTSKITDFSERELSLFGRWKTIYWAKVKYVDMAANTPVILSVSVDNGVYSSITQRYIGTGAGGTKDAYFHFVRTGKYFQFKVEWPSANKAFLFTGLEVALMPLGEEFETTSTDVPSVIPVVSPPAVTYEPALGNPAVNGYLLSSTTVGVRSWIAPASGSGTTHSILSATHTDSTAASVARGDIIIGGGVTPKWTRLAVGASTKYLAGGTEPSWATLNQAVVAGLTTADSPTFAGLTLTADLAVANGGTGASTFTQNGVLYGNAANAIGATAEGATGTYLKGTTSGAPSWATLTKEAVAGLLLASSPQFTGLTLSGLTASVPVVTDAGQALTSQTYANFKTSLVLAQADVSGLTTASSPVFVTAKLSALTDGYIPYHVSDAAGLADSKIYTDGTNTGVNTTSPKLPLQVQGVSSSPATSGTTPNGVFAMTMVDGSELFMGSYVASPYAIWLQGSNKGDLSTTYPIAINPRGGSVLIGATAVGSSERLKVVGTGAGAAFATSGTTQSTGHTTRWQGYSGNGILDLVYVGSGTWGIQATHATDLSVCYPLALNPVGGSVLIGATAAVGTELLRVAGTALVDTSITTPTILLTTGATLGYVWKCTNVSGAGGWASATASQVYKGTVDGDDGKYNGGAVALIDGTGTAGWYYRCVDAGTYDYGNPNGNSITAAVGDDIYYNGANWQLIPGSGYTLQPATDSVLGGIKVGGSLQINADVLNVNNADMGDITVSGSGADTGKIWTIDAGAVTYTKIAAMTSAQLAGIVSDETGSGALVFATSPTLVTPVLGTPTSGTLTNCTGLPRAGVLSIATTDDVIFRGPVVDVRSWSVLTTNPTGDNDKAWAALIAGITAGSTVYFPKGHYNFSDDLDVTVACKIVGDGAASIIHQTIDAKAGFLVAVDDVEIRSLHLIGTGGGALSDLSDAIRVTGAHDGYLARVRVEDCFIEAWKNYGIYLAFLQDFWVSGNRIYDIAAAGIEGISVQYGIITKNNIDTINCLIPAGAGYNGYGISISRLGDVVLHESERSDGVIISNNVITGVEDWEGIDTHSGDNLTIIGNLIRDCKYGIVATSSYDKPLPVPPLPDDRVVFPARNIQILGNSLFGTMTEGIEFGAAGYGATGMISGNLIASTVTTGITLINSTVTIGVNLNEATTAISNVSSEARVEPWRLYNLTHGATPSAMAGGGLVYADAGGLHYVGSSGTHTKLADA